MCVRVQLAGVSGWVQSLTKSKIDVQVRPSGPGRGNGAFAVREIPQGVCLGSYEGELIDEATYWARYPSGRVCCSTLPLLVRLLYLCVWILSRQ